MGNVPGDSCADHESEVEFTGTLESGTYICRARRMVQPKRFRDSCAGRDALNLRPAKAKGVSPLYAVKSNVDGYADAARKLQRVVPCSDSLRNVAWIDTHVSNGFRSILSIYATAGG